MIRKARVGEKVKIVNASHKEQSWSWIDGTHTLTMQYDGSKCNTGIVTDLRRIFSKAKRPSIHLIKVKLDSPNSGEMWCRPKELERIDEE